MNSQMVREQLITVQNVMNTAVDEISEYLNHYTIHDMLKEDGSQNKEYYALLLKTLRRLEVFCEEAFHKVTLLLQRHPFQQQPAEKVLYGIHHQCVLEFFSPRSDAWSENSRAAYTGKTAISYYDQPPYSFRKLMTELEDGFQKCREDLSYFETDYNGRFSNKTKGMS
ncbi:DUF3907 family protein [Pontibacillus salicampi]|uniref:DUF3907 family protein n=1 Tax=Pontibacillus salicampi TaxID=1449801 RepID=A0ABV6LL71_9BACI